MMKSVQVRFRFPVSETRTPVGAGIFGLHLEYFTEQPKVLSNPVFQESLRALGPGFLRFPGGEDADNYHWETKTVEHNDWFYSSADPENDLGTDEFLDWCGDLGAEPVICLNYDCGAFHQDYEAVYQEAMAWVRYIRNRGGKQVKYWEFGNEVFYETIGSKVVPTPADAYAQQYLEMRRRLHEEDPQAVLGLPLTHIWDQDETWVTAQWNSRVMEIVGDQVDYVILHPYFSEGYARFFSIGYDLEQTIRTIRKELAKYDCFAPIVVTEWGMEHRLPDICVDAAGSGLGVIEGALGMVQSGVCYANYWPTCWLIPTEGEAVWKGHDLGLISKKTYRLTCSGQALAWLHRELDGFSLQGTETAHAGNVHYRAYLAHNAEGTTAKLLVTNRRPDKSADCRVELPFVPGAVANSTVYTAECESANPYLGPDSCAFSPIETRLENNTVRICLPPASAAVVTFSL